MTDRTVKPFGSMAARDAVVSPDGRWVAYGTRSAATIGTAGNQNQVFVEPVPPTGAKYLLPLPGGHPVWTPNGDALVTNASPTSSYLTPVTTSPRFAFGPSAEFPRRGRTESNPLTSRRQVDMLPDGRVVGVMSQTAGPGPATSDIIVVLNWFDEVRQRVPGR
jgi:hypothetical protein